MRLISEEYGCKMIWATSLASYVQLPVGHLCSLQHHCLQSWFATRVTKSVPLQCYSEAILNPQICIATNKHRQPCMETHKRIARDKHMKYNGISWRRLRISPVSYYLYFVGISDGCFKQIHPFTLPPWLILSLPLPPWHTPHWHTPSLTHSLLDTLPHSLFLIPTSQLTSAQFQRVLL